MKLYQNHKCKTKPYKNRNSKSYLKRIEIIRKTIFRNLHPRDFGCHNSRASMRLLQQDEYPCNQRKLLKQPRCLVPSKRIDPANLGKKELNFVWPNSLIKLNKLRLNNPYSFYFRITSMWQMRSLYSHPD